MTTTTKPLPLWYVASPCNGYATWSCWPSEKLAKEAKDRLDAMGCGGRCNKGLHYVTTDKKRWMTPDRQR